jgi:hypothetical protein
MTLYRASAIQKCENTRVTYGRWVVTSDILFKECQWISRVIFKKLKAFIFREQSGGFYDLLREIPPSW